MTARSTSPSACEIGFPQLMASSSPRDCRSRVSASAIRTSRSRRAWRGRARTARNPASAAVIAASRSAAVASATLAAGCLV